MSLDDYLGSLPQERRESARRDLDALPVPEGQLEDVFEQAAYEAAAEMDPSVTRTSRVVMRIFGDDTVNASISNASAEALLGAFDREVRAAAGEGAADARLRLVGFSAGSVVLHFEPVRSEIEKSADGAIEVYSSADHAIETVLDLHRAIEAKRPPVEIRERFKAPGLLKAARAFVTALDDGGLDSSARWYAPAGNVSVATVTEVGRRYARDTLFATGPETEEETLSGLVRALDIDGLVTLAMGNRKPVVHVPKDLIESGEFVLGAFVQIVVSKRFDEDKVGLTTTPRFEFVRFAFTENEPLGGV